MTREFKYGFRNQKIKNSVILSDNGGAYPEIHYIQNISERVFFLKDKIFNKSSMFSFLIQKKKKYLFIKKNNIPSIFDSENLKIYYQKIINIKKNYCNNFFKNTNFLYYTRKLNNNKNQIIKITTKKNDGFIGNYRKLSHSINDKIKTQNDNIHITYKSLFQSLKIPKSISNWKNPRGFTIPLNLRICNKPDFVIEKNLNNKFLSTSNILDIAESKKNNSRGLRN